MTDQSGRIMPDRAAHEQRATDNEELVNHRLDMRVEVDRSWMVAALFYAGLHWVEAYFDTRSLFAKNHRQREQMIVSDPALGSSFYAVYLELSDRSQDARYELKSFSRANVHDLQIRCLGAIKAHIRELLS